MKNLSNKELETLALAFTINEDTMPTNSKELRNELVKFAEYLSNIKEL